MSGPSYCAKCGTWPAHPTARGLRCNSCDYIEYALLHPVPFPRDMNMLKDLADAGVVGAKEVLPDRLHNKKART